MNPPARPTPIPMPPDLTVICGDALTTLRGLPDESFQCVVTSPPYWALRDYGVAGQIGLESTIGEYLARLVDAFREIHRVLRPDGVAWVNMGDSYIGSQCGGQTGTSTLRNPGSPDHARRAKASWRRDRAACGVEPHRGEVGLKPKDLAGIPWRLAFALQADGWYLRSDNIWHKPNPMPESCGDRPTKAHEYVFLFSRSERYFYNSAEAREPVTGTAAPRMIRAAMEAIQERRKAGASATASNPDGHGVNPKARKEQYQVASTSSLRVACSLPVADRNYRSVWTIPSQALTDAHFAAFPEALARRCILAGSRSGDVVLDPFGGSGTVGRVALELGRKAVLIELNPEYVRLIHSRTNVTQGLPLVWQ
jgi:DNA modification methylase